MFCNVVVLRGYLGTQRCKSRIKTLWRFTQAVRIRAHSFVSYLDSLKYGVPPWEGTPFLGLPLYTMTPPCLNIIPEDIYVYSTPVEFCLCNEAYFPASWRNDQLYSSYMYLFVTIIHPHILPKCIWEHLPKCIQGQCVRSLGAGP